MPEYYRPGVYYQEADTSPAGRVVVRSDVPAFIGIAQRGPLDKPIPINSFKQFQAHFGDYIGAGFLAYSVRAFFDNGGLHCWIVRVASRDFSDDYLYPSDPITSSNSGLGARSAFIKINDGNQDVLVIEASSEGSWGNNLSVSLVEEFQGDVQVEPGNLHKTFAQVSTTAGLERGSLIILSQQDSANVLKTYRRVISYIDESNRRIYWKHPQDGAGLVYDQSVSGFDGNTSARIYDVSYRINVFQNASLITSYSKLSLVPEHPNYAPRILAPYEDEAFHQKNLTFSKIPSVISVRNLRTNLRLIPKRLNIDTLVQYQLENGQDGLSKLTHTDFIGEDFSVQDSDFQRKKKSRGIWALNTISQITLIAVPDIVIQPQVDTVYQPEESLPTDPCLPCSPARETEQQFVAFHEQAEMPPEFSESQIFQVQAAMIAHCESRGDRFAVIDPPYQIAENSESGIAEIQAWRKRFDSSYAAIYYPWIKVIEPRVSDSNARVDELRAIPPSGHAIGQYALFDNETGAHRAPANRALNWCQDLTLHTSFGQQELLNALGINVIRSESSRGLRIMGARTLSSDISWRYINIRRLLIMIRRSLEIVSQWVVFEPNNALTRNKFQTVISGYLEALWQRGALSGETASQSFFVKCDEENNPSYQRNNGELLAEIGVAPSHPFEFIVLRIGMQENQLEIRETRLSANAA